MAKPNIKYKTTCGKDLWHSRSVATCSLLTSYDWASNQKLVLIGKRGPAVSHAGLWCLPCGYIDWDETVEEAAVREVREETGVIVNSAELIQYEIHSDPKAFLQNVTIHFKYYFHKNTPTPHMRNAAEGEVEELMWANWSQVRARDFAFDHKERIIKNVFV